MVHHTDTVAGGSHCPCASDPVDPLEGKRKGTGEGKGWGQVGGGVGGAGGGRQRGKSRGSEGSPFVDAQQQNKLIDNIMVDTYVYARAGFHLSLQCQCAAQRCLP